MTMSNTNVVEKRKRSRVGFSTQIVLRIGDSEIKVDGSSKDLSLKGVFVNTGEAMDLGAACQVEVFLTGMTEAVVLRMDGRIARIEETGVAVIFDSMDVDSYTHLKNVLRYKSENPDEIR
jgi:multidrug efflux pump subunit AcrA (membrane-fusion protein)